MRCRTDSDHAEAHGLDVLVVCSTLSAGGTERVVATMVGAWVDRGCRVGVATLADSRDLYALPAGVVRLRVDGGRLRRVLAPMARALRPVIHGTIGPARRGQRVLAPVQRQVATLATVTAYASRARALRRDVERLAPAAVVSLGAQNNLVAILACGGLPCRLVVSERNDIDRQPVGDPIGRLRRRMYPRADVVTANSQGTLAALGSWLPGEKLRFTPNPLVVPVGSRHGPPPPGFRGPSVLIVARLVEQKAHDVLLAALARLPPELDAWRLAVVGGGRRKQALHRLAEELRVAHRVDWYGTTDDPYAFYRHADVFALPSRWEGTPNALLEAMSFGLPPVVTDASPGPLEVVRHGETGLVVPADDPEALAAALSLLAGDAGLRAKLGGAARAEVERFGLVPALAAWDNAIGEGRGPRLFAATRET